MLSKPFENLSSNNSAFNDEVSTVADGRESGEECCRPTRVMSVTKEIWLQKPKSVEVTLAIAPLVDYICGCSINDDLIDRVLEVSFCCRKVT